MMLTFCGEIEFNLGKLMESHILLRQPTLKLVSLLMKMNKKTFVYFFGRCPSDACYEKLGASEVGQDGWGGSCRHCAILVLGYYLK